MAKYTWSTIRTGKGREFGRKVTVSTSAAVKTRPLTQFKRKLTKESIKEIENRLIDLAATSAKILFPPASSLIECARLFLKNRKIVKNGVKALLSRKNKNIKEKVIAILKVARRGVIKKMIGYFAKKSAEKITEIYYKEGVFDSIGRGLKSKSYTPEDAEDIKGFFNASLTVLIRAGTKTIMRIDR